MIKDFVIMNSGLGKFGDPDNELCLQDDNFGQGHYKPVYCVNTKGPHSLHIFIFFFFFFLLYFLFYVFFVSDFLENKPLFSAIEKMG